MKQKNGNMIIFHLCLLLNDFLPHSVMTWGKCQLLPGRHKVHGRRPEAKIDELYNLINIGLIRRIWSWLQTPVMQIMASVVYFGLWCLNWTKDFRRKTTFMYQKGYIYLLCSNIFKYGTRGRNFGKTLSWGRQKIYATLPLGVTFYWR